MVLPLECTFLLRCGIGGRLSTGGRISKPREGKRFGPDKRVMDGGRPSADQFLDAAQQVGGRDGLVGVGVTAGVEGFVPIRRCREGGKREDR
jgi:hypothetical protein